MFWGCHSHFGAPLKWQCNCFGVNTKKWSKTAQSEFFWGGWANYLILSINEHFSPKQWPSVGNIQVFRDPPPPSPEPIIKSQILTHNWLSSFSCNSWTGSPTRLILGSKWPQWPEDQFKCRHIPHMLVFKGAAIVFIQKRGI